LIPGGDHRGIASIAEPTGKEQNIEVALPEDVVHPFGELVHLSRCFMVRGITGSGDL